MLFRSPVEHECDGEPEEQGLAGRKLDRFSRPLAVQMCIRDRDIGIDRPQKNEILHNIPPTPQQTEFIERLVQFAKSGDATLLRCV